MKQAKNLIFSVLFSVFIILAFCSSFVSCGNKKFEYEMFQNLSYGNHERQVLDLYLPKEATSAGLILFIHGGCWEAGDKYAYQSECEKWCENYGYATATINYRYISETSSCENILSDIGLGLEKIKSFAQGKNINIEKVLLTGSSAGGHISLLYAYKCSENSAIKPVAVVDYCGPTDLTDAYYFSDEQKSEVTLPYFSLFSNLVGETITKENLNTPEIKAKLLEFSPITYVCNSTVPTVICHGVKDEIVPISNANVLKQKLDLFGIKNDFVVYKNSGHSLSADKQQKKQAKKFMEEYAKKYLA